MIRLILHATPPPPTPPFAIWCFFFFDFAPCQAQSRKYPRATLCRSDFSAINYFSWSREKEGKVLLFSPLRTQSGGSFNLARTQREREHGSLFSAQAASFQAGRPLF
jgi:hypothetical protein